MNGFCRPVYQILMLGTNMPVCKQIELATCTINPHSYAFTDQHDIHVSIKVHVVHRFRLPAEHIFIVSKNKPMNVP